MLTAYNKIRDEIKVLDEEYNKTLQEQYNINEKRRGLIHKKNDLEKKIISGLLGKYILTTISDKKTVLHIKEITERIYFIKGSCIQWEDEVPILKMRYTTDGAGILFNGIKEISEEEWKSYLQECFETEEFKNL